MISGALLKLRHETSHQSVSLYASIHKPSCLWNPSVYLQQHLDVWRGFPQSLQLFLLTGFFFNWLAQKAITKGTCGFHLAAHSLDVSSSSTPRSLSFAFQTPLNIFLILWQPLTVVCVQPSQPTQWLHPDSVCFRQPSSYWYLIPALLPTLFTHLSVSLCSFVWSLSHCHTN